jgi:hypothetical protein
MEGAFPELKLLLMEGAFPGENWLDFGVSLASETAESDESLSVEFDSSEVGGFSIIKKIRAKFDFSWQIG